MDGLMPEWAIRRAYGWGLGARLCTKDGRKCGNATIADIEISVIKRKPVWVVFTDAGSEMVLSEEELCELFYVPAWVVRIETAPGYRKWQLQKKSEAKQ